MSSSDQTEKIVTRDLGKAIKPVAMTPLNAAVKPISGEDRGLKTVPMTPVQPARPASAPAQPAQSPKK
jgi:hypothetical protein